MSFYRAFTFFGVVFQLNFKNSIIVMEAFSFPHFHITQKEHQITKNCYFLNYLFSFDLVFLGSSFATTNPISFDFFSHRLIICLNSAGNEEKKDGVK